MKSGQARKTIRLRTQESARNARSKSLPKKRARKPATALTRALDKLAEEGARVSPNKLYFPFGPPVVDED